MGYCVTINNSKFEIASTHIADVLKAVWKTPGGYETPAEAKKEIKYFDHLPPIIQLKELVLRLFGFEFELDKAEKTVIGIRWHWEKYTNQEDLFKVIAPFVANGSMIEWRDEDGELWRDIFDGEKCLRKEPKVTWA